MLEIVTFGGLAIRYGGALKSSFRQRKEAALLGYLACTRSPQPREVVAELLWPDRSQTQALSNLRVVIMGLREQLSAYLTITRQTIAFDTANPYWLDVEAFETYLTQADRTRPYEPNHASQSADYLEQALALYKGDFLAGFSVRDSQAFEDWLLLERDRYRQYVIDVLRRLVSCYCADANFTAAIIHLSRLTQLEPFLEDAHRQLIQLYEWTGQRSAALRQFELCRRVLEQELGIPPETETIALYERVRASTLPLPTPSVTGNAQAQGLSNLPHQITPFVGRATELATISDHLEDANCRLVTLLGPGGSGKTRLALQCALMTRFFAHGAHFVPLAAITSAGLLASAIANALRISFSGREPQEDQLLNYLREKQMLLVMDNYEQLLPEIDLIVRILETAPNVKILVTSRERLNLVGETRVHVDGMDYPEGAVADSTRDYTAVKLFLQTARRVQPDLAVDGDYLTEIAHICRWTQGLPLAILLAAGWVDSLSLSEIAQQIEQNLDFLQATQRDIPPRQRSMRAVFEHSWQLLSPEERALFASLSIFRGGFTWQAGQEVADASRHALAALMNKSMLRRDASGRYDMHELLRQYGREKLREAGTEEAVQDKHCGYFARFMREREPYMLAASQVRSMAEIELDLDNIRLAWRHAYMHALEHEIHQLVYTLGAFYTLRAMNKENLTLFSEAVEYIETHEPDGAESLKVGLILPWLGWKYSLEGDRQKGRAMLCRAIPILRQHKLAFETGTALWMLSDASDLAESNRLAAECLEIFTALDAKIWMAGALFRLGWNAAQSGDLARADELIQQAAVISRPIGHRDLLAWALQWQASRAIDVENYALAERNFEEMRVMYIELRLPPSIAASLEGLGLCAYLQGNYPVAQAHFREALALNHDAGLQHYMHNGIIWLGFPAAALHNQREAAEHYRDALRWLSAKDVVFPVLLACVGVAQLLGMQGRLGAAVKLLWFSLNHPDYSSDYWKLARVFLNELEGQMTPQAFAAAKVSSQELSVETAILWALQVCDRVVADA